MDTTALKKGQFVDPGGDESLWCACGLCGQELKYSEAMSHALMHQKMKAEEKSRKAIIYEHKKRSSMDQEGSEHIPTSEIIIRSASVESTDSGISMNGISTDFSSLVNSHSSAMTMTLNYEGNINPPAQPQVQSQAKARGRKPRMDANNIVISGTVSKRRQPSKKLLKNMQALSQMNAMSPIPCNGMDPYGNPCNCPNAIALRHNQPPLQVPQNGTNGGQVYFQQQFNQQPHIPPRDPSMSQIHNAPQFSSTSFQKPPPAYSQVINQRRQQHYPQANVSTRDEWQRQAQPRVNNLLLSQMQQTISGPSSSQFQSPVQQTKHGAWNGQQYVQNSFNSSKQQRPSAALPNMQISQCSPLVQQQHCQLEHSIHQLSQNSGAFVGPPKPQSPATDELRICSPGSSSTPLPPPMVEAVYDDSLIFHCEFCSQLFKTEGEISNHLRVDHRIPKEYRWCRTCGDKVEANERALRQHIWEVHGLK